eukprot:CAMPEP_0118878292 /NCGR_PEP_ID=MMETSP1163-20130328/18237_1 /TAXON_ID=124430 /ORGANISM="Phaeomonas parva, Strain CCMP2877" /LENGTH=412 /DNA_ID=CAMNT_0006814101 /DNA_START=117 /DNA_END=1355 /DNA_ORIENTATION=+
MAILAMAVPVMLRAVQSRDAGAVRGAAAPPPPAAEVHGEEPAHAPQKVILDCDPGVDDVLAIWWLASAEQQGFVDLLAVTTVAGNAGGGTAFRNAAIATNFHEKLRTKPDLAFGRSGQDNPSDGFFGADGMSNLSQLMLDAAMPDGGLEELLPSFEQAPDAVDVIVSTLLSEEEDSVTLVAIGPLTNIAEAEKRSPGILARAREIIVMGGGFGFHGPHSGVDGYSARGNVKANAEFNFWSDAESARFVLDAATRAVHAPDIVLMPLDATQQLCWTQEENAKLAKAVAAMLPARRARLGQSVKEEEVDMVTELLGEMVDRLEEPLVKRAQRCLYLHDPSAVGFLLYPHLFHMRRMQVQIGRGGAFEGHTFADLRPQPQGPPNAFVAAGVEAHNFLMALRRDFALLAVEKALEN